MYRFITGWRRRCVAGLDMTSQGLHWVVVLDSMDESRQVLVAQSLAAPVMWTPIGALAQPESLARILRALLQEAPCKVDALYLALPDEHVVQHRLSLSDQLEPEDVNFQIQAEMSALFPDLEGAACIDHRCLPCAGAAVVTMPRVHEAVAAHRVAVQSLQHLARLAGVRLGAVGVRGEALALLPDARKSDTSAGLVVAPEQATAYALASLSWRVGTFNLLANCTPLGQDARRRRLHRLAGCAVLGIAVVGVWDDALTWVTGMLGVDQRAGAPQVTSVMAASSELQSETGDEHSPPEFDQAVTRTPLQEVPLARLRYVGTISRESISQALVQVVDDPAAKAHADVQAPVHRVAVGDGMGPDAGRLQRIAPEALHVRQWLQVASGAWRSEEVVLPLQDGGTR